MTREIVLRRVTAAVSLLAVAVWLGGLLALGAIAAPAVFSIVPMPASADAMTVVFRRFDAVAMSCAAVLLASEATRVLVRVRFSPVDHARAAASVVAAAIAVFEGTIVSPRIAALHAAGAIRGADVAGRELARLHDIAELCGKAEVVLLAAVIVTQVIALSYIPEPARHDSGVAP
jgi:uncharacterized membrane protein